MAGTGRRWSLVWALTLVLLMPAGACAGLISRPRSHRTPDCPAGSYSPLHYWAPSLYSLRAYHHGSAAGMYAPQRYPAIPPGYRIDTYPCPAVDPAALPYGAGRTPRPVPVPEP